MKTKISRSLDEGADVNISEINDERVADVRHWSARGDMLITARLGDAKAHAWNALTRGVVNMPDGRPTRRAAMSTRGYAAAVARLYELKGALVDMIKEARGSFYKDSFTRWPHLPDVLRAADVGATKRGASVARNMLIHGSDVRQEIAEVIMSAQRGMGAAVTMAGSDGVSDNVASSMLDAWEKTRHDAIKHRVDLTLSDSEVAIYNLVGRELVDEQFHA